MTQKLYYEDAYTTECEAEVTSCIRANDGWRLKFSRTCFFPGGGGHPIDLGYADRLRITNVFEENGDIIHISDKPLTEGSTVKLCVDRGRRLSAMRIHTAEHIISGLFWREYGIKNVGFHMDLDRAVIDLAGEVTPEMLHNIEKSAYSVVLENVSVHSWYPSDPLSVHARKLPEKDEPLRMVEVTDVDICGCCGLHVSHTGEAGLIKLISCEHHRGGSRITMLAGISAFTDYSEKHAVCTSLAARYSTQVCDITGAVARAEQKLSETKRMLSAANAKLLEYTTAELISQNAASGESWITAAFDGDIIALCDKLSKHKSAAVFSDVSSGTRYCIISATEDIRPLCKALNDALCGRGGGKPGFCQGSVTTCSANEAVKFFRDLISRSF